MYRARLKKALCVVLVFVVMGCRGDYHLKVNSSPPGAAVIIEQNRYGTTPCELNIPTDNELVRDGSMTIKYVLPDGREITQTYDLAAYKPPNLLATIGVLVFAVPGVLLVLAGDKDDDDDDWDDDDDDYNYQAMGAGFGLLGVAALIAWVFKPHHEGLGGYDIHVIFPSVGDAPNPVTEPNMPSEAPPESRGQGEVELPANVDGT